MILKTPVMTVNFKKNKKPDHFWQTKMISYLKITVRFGQSQSSSTFDSEVCSCESPAQLKTSDC